MFLDITFTSNKAFFFYSAFLTWWVKTNSIKKIYLWEKIHQRKYIWFSFSKYWKHDNFSKFYFHVVYDYRKRILLENIYYYMEADFYSCLEFWLLNKRKSFIYFIHLIQEYKLLSFNLPLCEEMRMPILEKVFINTTEISSITSLAFKHWSSDIQ